MTVERRKKPLVRDLLLTGVIAVAVLALAYRLINGNFAYIYLAATIGALIGTVFLSTRWIKNGFLLLTAVFLSATLGEAALRALAADEGGAPPRAAYTKGYSLPFRQNGGPLGYAAFPDRQVRAWKTVGEERVYDAVYGISPEGIRVTPGDSARPDEGQTFVFFGGSYAFGEGLNDDETLPFYFASALGFAHPGPSPSPTSATGRTRCCAPWSWGFSMT